MILTAALLAAALGTPASAGAPAAPRADAAATEISAVSAGGMVSLSLIEALTAIKQPQLAGIFSFVNERDAPFAFADLMARDKKSLKQYLSKLDDDRKLGGGLTDWDHAVCASLVNLYSSPMAATFGQQDPKILTRINQCVLSQVVPLEAIASKRRK